MQTLIDLMQKFNCAESFKSYLVDQKWGNGFVCHRCGCSHAAKGCTRKHRCCDSCRFDESATATPPFNKTKLPLLSAFVRIQLLTTIKKGINSCVLARQLSVHQETAGFFKRKVQLGKQACEEGGLIVHNIEVDETFLGGCDEGKRVRSKCSNSLVLDTFEVDCSAKTRSRARLKRCNASLIENDSGELIKLILETSVEVLAVRVSEGWRGYLSAVTGNWHIFNPKKRVRGTNHHVSRDQPQFCLWKHKFSFNNRSQNGQQAAQALANMETALKSSYLQLMAN